MYLYGKTYYTESLFRKILLDILSFIFTVFVLQIMRFENINKKVMPYEKNY
jgi:hypothetical protein